MATFKVTFCGELNTYHGNRANEVWPTTLEEEELPPPFYENGELWKMKQQERDELWGRIDERTCNIYQLVEKQETHLRELNDSVKENAISCAKNKTGIRNLWAVLWAIVGIIVTAGTTIGLVIAL